MKKDRNKILFYTGDINRIKSKLNIYVLEQELNKDIISSISNKYNIINYNINRDIIKLGNIEYYKIAEISGGMLYLKRTIPERYIPVILYTLVDVIIVGRVKKVSLGLEIIDMALIDGKEIICVCGKGGKLWYLSRHLANDGAIVI